MACGSARPPFAVEDTHRAMSPDPHAATLPSSLRPKIDWRGLVAVIGTMAMMAMFYGYTGPLFSIVLEAHGVPGSLIGISAAVQMTAVFILLPFVPRLIRHFGPARVITTGVVVALVALTLMGLYVDVWLWFPLRFLLGGAQSMMWTTGETWINHVSDDRVRGRTIAVFSSAIATGFSMGPFLQAWTGMEGHLPFIVGGLLVAGCLLPLVVSYGSRIEAEGRSTVRLHQYLRLAPLPMVSNFVFSAIATSIMSLVSVYGLRLGMDRSSAVEAIGWMGWGGVAMPLLIGYLADRIDRRALLSCVVVLGALGCVALPWILPLGGAGVLCLMLFGGIRSSQYSLTVMLLGERFRGADLPSATAVFGFMYGCGSIAGPSISGFAMDWWDPHGLPAAVTLYFLLFLPMPVIAWVRRRRGIA